MITAVNSTNSFKAILTPANERFSDAQLEVCDDIEKKLGKRAQKRNYVLRPGIGDSVRLYNTSGITKNGSAEIDEEVLFGTYSKEKPFNVKKLDNYYRLSACFKAIVVGAVVGAIALLFAMFHNKNSMRHHCDPTRDNIAFLQKFKMPKNFVIAEFK